MSAIGTKRTFRHSFDYLVGAREHGRRHGEAEGLGGLEIWNDRPNGASSGEAQQPHRNPSLPTRLIDIVRTW